MKKLLVCRTITALALSIVFFSSSCIEQTNNDETLFFDSSSPVTTTHSESETVFCESVYESQETDIITDVEDIVPEENEITSIPIINIVTDGGVDITSKSEYVRASMSIQCDENSGFFDSNISDIGIRIKGRGNASWNQFPKKSYRIKLDEGISLLGLKKDKDWVLVSNYADKSLMRNIVAHNMAKKLDNLEFTPEHIAVELFLNGAYRGVYTFAEKIEFGGGKLEYTADATLEDTSYLLEVGWDYNDEMIYGMNYFDTEYILRIVIKEPKFTKKYTPSGKYIINYLKKAEAAVQKLDGYREYIDVDSLIDHLIITEFTNNTESVFYRSLYMYKPSGEKLKFGPVWDFDMSFGNHISDIKDYNGWCSVDNDFSYLGKEGVTWFNFLFQDPEFTSKFAERWDEVKDELLQTALETIDSQEKAMDEAQKRNFELWRIMNKKIGAGKVDHRTYNTYELQVEYLRDFIINRYNWIDENISEFRFQ